MKIKSGVSVLGLKPEILVALQVAERIWSDYGHVLVLTSGTEGDHQYNSDHYKGLAVDLRNRFFTGEQKVMVTNDLRESLGSEFSVIVHYTHIHISYVGNRR